MKESTPTILELFSATVARRSHLPALGTIEDGHLTWQTWEELADKVQQLVSGILQTGTQPGDRLVNIGENCAEWITLDLAILSLGAIHVPLHPSNATQAIAEQIAFIEPKLVFLSSTVAAKLKDVPLNAPTIIYHPLDGGLRPAELRRAGPFAAIDWDEFLGEGSLNELSRGPSPNDLATLLFTSGTSGKPRVVMLSHRNLAFDAIATSEAVGSATEETRLCFLPLSHIYARTCDLYSWLYRGTRLVLAESRETILRDCQLVRPAVINGVPYFYQKVAQQLLASGKGEMPGVLQEVLGGEIRRCFCGGAAVAPQVEAVFEKQGLPLLSGYGLTEAAPVVTASSAENYRAGSVGRPLPGVEVSISEDGEILVRGPNVTAGYWRDEAATREGLVDDWLHTGDLGRFDEAGNLCIVGRRKEIIVLSTGKNVVPSRVESLLLGSPLIENVCVVGDGRKCLAALIVPNPEMLRAEIRRRRLWVWSKRRAVSHPTIRQLYRGELDRLLADAPPEEQVGPFAMLTRGFSIEREELTAKLSLQRAVIQSNFAREIDAMYAS